MNIPPPAQIVVPLPATPPQSGPPPPAPPVPPPPPPPANLPVSINGAVLENSVEDAAMDISLLLKVSKSCLFSIYMKILREDLRTVGNQVSFTPQPEQETQEK